MNKIKLSELSDAIVCAPSTNFENVKAVVQALRNATKLLQQNNKFRIEHRQNCGGYITSIDECTCGAVDTAYKTSKLLLDLDARFDFDEKAKGEK
jgi:hypothetical protein